jgi:protein-L-isoaspartate(D-aspartate) O-methyltransferase
VLSVDPAECVFQQVELPTMKSVLCLACFLSLVPMTQALGDDFEEQRQTLVNELETYGAYIGNSREAFRDDVLNAILTVPRHELVPERQVRYAYENRPLPIGHGQTISQPYIVALMTQLLEPESGDVVLEVGTGSGYQAAVLAELVKTLYSIEIIRPLAERAAADLERLDFANVVTRLGDGYHGWPEHAPFDGIVVTAAASHVPPPLVQQLKPGGRIVIPVGSAFMTQQLLLVEKTADGDVVTRQIAAVRFVPLTGDR